MDDERGLKKHKDYIAPGSKEDVELTRALHKVFDEWNWRSSERSESPNMNSYYADMAQLPVRDEDLKRLWHKNLIAIQPLEGEHKGSKQTQQQQKEQRRAEKAFSALSEAGGYVWISSPRGTSVRVGRVRPGTEPGSFNAILREPSVPSLHDADQLEVKLTTLPLEDVQRVASDEAMALRSMRNPRGPLDLWTEVGAWLADLVEGRPVEHRWANLRPELRLAVCAEYLRHHENPHHPRLARLLLPVDDRDPGKMGTGPYHADIYGLAEDGMEILAQVPLADDNMKYNIRMHRKLKALKAREGKGRKLVCFWDFVSAAIGGTPPSADAEPLFWNGVLLLAVEEVLRWVEEQPDYAEKLFSA